MMGVAKQHGETGVGVQETAYQYPERERERERGVMVVICV